MVCVVKMTDSEDVYAVNNGDLTTKQKMYFEHYMNRLIKSNLDILILRALKDRPMCGYDLIKTIFQKYNIFLSQGAVYPLLYKLKDQGILQAEFDQGNMRSKIYSIKADSEEIVNDRLNEFIRAAEYTLDSIASSDDQKGP